MHIGHKAPLWTPLRFAMTCLRFAYVKLAARSPGMGWQPTLQTVGTASACVYADADGNILDNPPLADDIAQDPLLQSLKLIAWVADDTLLPRLDERGFPHWGIWAERNKAFQRDMTSWLAHSQSGLASAVATR